MLIHIRTQVYLTHYWMHKMQNFVKFFALRPKKRVSPKQKSVNFTHREIF